MIGEWDLSYKFQSKNTYFVNIYKCIVNDDE